MKTTQVRAHLRKGKPVRQHTRIWRILYEPFGRGVRKNKYSPKIMANDAKTAGEKFDKKYSNRGKGISIVEF